MSAGATGERGPLALAARAEAAGDLMAAIAALRAHLAAHPDDRPTRVRLGRVLRAAGEAKAARESLAPLERDLELGLEVNALLADLAETEGRLAAAAEHWERVLADDVDHARARRRLAALLDRQTEDDLQPNRDAATFVSPEGVATLRYRLLRELGRGATATVYLARDDSLAIDVALKILHPHLAGSARSDARSRFFAEARLAARLRHPGIAAILDLDEATRTLVLEYLPGGTLRTRMAQGALPWPELVATARGLIDALAHVHGQGIVHGDLKPSNILLRERGEPVLVDFGVAHLNQATVPTASRPAVGTLLYQAPEQIRGALSNQASDLFSLGAVLFEMVARRPLRTLADLANPNRPIESLDLPVEAEALGELIERLLATDPALRLPSAELALRFL